MSLLPHHPLTHPSAPFKLLFIMTILLTLVSQRSPVRSSLPTCLGSSDPGLPCLLCKHLLLLTTSFFWIFSLLFGLPWSWTLLVLLLSVWSVSIAFSGSSYSCLLCMLHGEGFPQGLSLPPISFLEREPIYWHCLSLPLHWFTLPPQCRWLPNLSLL